MNQVEFQVVDNIPDKPLSKWNQRFDQLKDGQALVVYPSDRRELHSLRTMAHQVASRRNEKINTRFTTRDGKLELYIWLV